MSFISNRTITLSRPILTGRVAGIVGVQEYRDTDYTLVAAKVPCSIQFERLGGKPLGRLPGDTRAAGEWAVYILLGNCRRFNLTGRNSVQRSDLMIDDAGRHFQVGEPEWTPLGWNIRVELLAA